MDKTSCTIMFVDIGGSTQMYETLGDEVAKHAVDICVSHLSDAVTANRGAVIKTIGDGVMCRFETADDALQAAMQCIIEIAELHRWVS